MSTKLSVVVNDKLKTELETVSSNSGLNQSEIIRRGILNEISDIRGDLDD